MAKTTENYLQILKELCDKVETERDCSDAVASLKKQISIPKNQTFFEYHTFTNFLDILARNQNIPTKNKNEIFKLMNSIVVKGSDSCLGKLHGYLLSNKDRPELVSEFYSICNFETEPKTLKPEILFGISEILLRYSHSTSEQRKFLVRNFESHFANHAANKDSSLKLLQSFHRCIATLIRLNDWMIVESVLKVTILKNSHFPADKDECQKEIVKIFDCLMKYGFEQKSLMKVCEKVAESLAHSNEVHKLCFGIIQWMFKKRSDIISEKEMKELKSKFYENVKIQGTSVLYQKVTSMVARFFTLKINDFEMTSGCFAAYHYLIVAFFHVFRNVANEENVYACCSDIKRHEVHNANASIFSFGTKLLAQDKFTVIATKHLLYHVSYDAQICSEFKCSSKEKLKLLTFNRIYSALYEFSTKKNLDSEIFSFVNEYINIIYKLWNLLPKEMKSLSQEPNPLVLKIYDLSKSEKTAVTCANGIASIMKNIWNSERSGKDVTKTLMKNVILMREASTAAGFSSSYEFRKSKNYQDASFCQTGVDIPLDEFLLLEITALFRYCPNENVEVFGKFLVELFSITKDPKILAKSCQVVNDAILNTIDIDKFSKVTKILEVASKKFDFEVSLALALNNYYMYSFLFEKTSSDLKKDDKKAIEKLDLKKELEQFKYLNESLRHFTDVISHLMECKDNLDKIQSVKRLTTILLNIAVQYNVRGIKFKDIEAFTLVWHFSNFFEENIPTLLHVGVFFLDNHQLTVDASGNYVRVSKKIKPLTIEEVLAKLNKLVDGECAPNYGKLPASVQCHVASYLLSLWVYYLSNGRKSDGVKRLHQFKSLWHSIEIPKDSASFETIRSKIYFCLVEININCFNRCADNFLSIAVGILMNVKAIDRDFSYHFYQIYHRINFKAINYSLNRLSDMNHYDVVMASLILLAARKGYCFKVLELLSLSILRNLNMEKIDHSKTQLKEITKLIGLSEDILIETPSKFEAPVTMFDYESATIPAARKAAVEPNSPIQCEFSMIHEDHSAEMSRQLEAFVHESSCKCEICKIPQLKFIMFQIGCHYSRLLWMTNKGDISMRFNEFAFEKWQNVSDKLRRMKDCEFLTINKTEFAVFSIRWLFQCADTMIRLSYFEEVEEIYKEVELICIDSVPDNECFKQALHCRKEIVAHLLEHGLGDSNESENAELSFIGFKANRDKKKPKKCPSLIKRAVTAQALNPNQTDVIYIDSGEESTSKTPKKPKKTTKLQPPATPKLLPPATPKLQPPATPKLQPPATPKPKPQATVTIDLTSETPAKSSTRPTRRRMM